MIDIVELPVRDEGVPRDGRGKPLVVPKGGGKPRALTRMTTFVDAVEDKSNITNWKTRNVLSAATLAQCRGILEAAEGLDPNGQAAEKQKLNALVESIMDKSGANDKREKGTVKHGFTELADAGLPLPESASAADRADIAAYVQATVLFDIKHTERFCVVDQYGIGGTPDRVAAYCGPGPLPGTWFDSAVDGLLITDVKTGNVEYGALKMAGQLGGYSRAEFYDHTLFPIEPVLHKRTGQPLSDPDGKKALAAWKKTEFPAELAAKAYTPMGDINQEWGIIIHLPADQGECSLHWINLTVGWDTLELCERIRQQRSIKGVIFPVFPDESASVTGDTEDEDAREAV